MKHFLNFLNEYDMLTEIVYQLTNGTNIEVYDISEIKIGERCGLKFDLFDYLNKITDFESDVENLLMELDEILKKKYLFSHHYSPEMEICDIDGELYPDYHCYLRIYRKGGMKWLLLKDAK